MPDDKDFTDSKIRMAAESTLHAADDLVRAAANAILSPLQLMPGIKPNVADSIAGSINGLFSDKTITQNIVEENQRSADAHTASKLAGGALGAAVPGVQTVRIGKAIKESIKELKEFTPQILTEINIAGIGFAKKTGGQISEVAQLGSDMIRKTISLGKQFEIRAEMTKRTEEIVSAAMEVGKKLQQASTLGSIGAYWTASSTKTAIKSGLSDHKSDTETRSR